MNIPYEVLGNDLRQRVASISSSEPIQLLVKHGTKLGKSFRKKRISAALAVGFVGGVGATLFVVHLAKKVKCKCEKARSIELVRDDADEEDVPET